MTKYVEVHDDTEVKSSTGWVVAIVAIVAFLILAFGLWFSGVFGPSPQVINVLPATPPANTAPAPAAPGAAGAPGAPGAAGAPGAPGAPGSGVTTP